MAHATPVQLIRSSDATPMVALLSGMGAPLRKLIGAVGLPESFEDGGTGFIPFRTMLRFAGNATISQDIDDLCWRGVMTSAPDQLGGWGRAVAAAPTLRRAILAFCEAFKRDAPLMDIGLEVNDDYAWFWRSRPRSVIGWLGDEEGQQYALAAMTRVVRTAAGPDWVPPHIRLESCSARWTRSIDSLAACNIDLEQPVVAIAIPYDLLDRPRLIDPCESSPSPALQAAEPTLAGSLRQAFESLLPAAEPTLEIAAEIAGLSPRRLRRMLAEEQTGWRRVRDEARLGVSVRLLRETELPIAEIATQLRYSDAAHFIRAFKRWTSESPREYRRRHFTR